MHFIGCFLLSWDFYADGLKGPNYIFLLFSNMAIILGGIPFYCPHSTILISFFIDSDEIEIHTSIVLLSHSELKCQSDPILFHFHGLSKNKSILYKIWLFCFCSVFCVTVVGLRCSSSDSKFSEIVYFLLQT